ncbi:PP2C family protein-serine/threonine phosphatase [Isoptericola sp. b490]|nr:PP2C family protein-serine/threonine phosphatase [Isoptericola sp. b490]
MLTGQPVLGTLLVALSVLVAAGIAAIPDWVPPATMLLVLLGAVVVLRRVAMATLAVAIGVEIAVIGLPGWTPELTPGTIVVLGVATVASLLFVRSRERLGLQGAPSQLMLVDLRDRIAEHGRIPELPEGWRVESLVRSAYGEGFSGDFVVAARGADGPLLEIVLVDVSGKGQRAGVRSLLLSGAFGGLLGAMPPASFLPAANAYLLDQHWDEGFATAVHLAVELRTGEYWVTYAGHPPALHLHRSTGRLEVVRGTGGPVLGVVAAPSFAARHGALEHGDTLLLYTDGLVESPKRDLELGIDRLMGTVEQLITTGRGGAADLLAALDTGEGDDRGLVLVQRT